MFSGIAHQKFEQLNELHDSDYSISDNSDKSDESSSDDSSIHSNAIPLQTKNNNTNITLRRSTRTREVPFVSIIILFVIFVFNFYIVLDVQV